MTSKPSAKPVTPDRKNEVVSELLRVNAAFADVAKAISEHGNEPRLHDARGLLEYAHSYLRVLVEHPPHSYQAKDYSPAAKVITLNRILDGGVLLDYYNAGRSPKARENAVSLLDVLARVRADLAALA